MLTALILLAGGALQSTVGFAYGLFAIPLLIWIDIPVYEVLALILVSTFVQSLVGCRALREHLPWRNGIIATVIRIVFTIGGVFILHYMVNENQDLISAVVGGILICSVLLLWKMPKRKTDHVQNGLLYTFIAPVSGVLSGVIGMGGPPLLLWAMSQPWSPQRIRAFMFLIMSTGAPAQLLILVAAFGLEVLWGAALGALCIPVVFIGSHLGITFGNKLSKRQLSVAVYLLLLVLGIKSIIDYIIA